MNWKKLLIGGGLAAAAPFTGGSSLAWLPAALATTGVGTAVSGVTEKSVGSGKTPDAIANDPNLATLQSSSTALRGQGTALQSMGADALQPVLAYFSKLAGGDPQALLEATRPERARVIDQYDTARKAISDFSPRGGGSNAALASSRFAEASDLSNITANMRSNAASAAGNLGTTLTGLGLSAQQLASADLNTVINAVLTQQGFDVTKHGQNAQAASGIAEGLGTLLGLYLTRGGGGAGGGGNA